MHNYAVANLFGKCVGEDVPGSLGAATGETDLRLLRSHVALTPRTTSNDYPRKGYTVEVRVQR